MTDSERYMARCIQLAKMGAGEVAPNPMVGSVLVHDNIIIGEGFHKKFGQPHAEVNCIHSVREENKILIPESTLYVSLEPCSHVGKTPPCTDLIIKNKIRHVVIGCKDIFKEVSGRGIQQLKKAGIEVDVGILEKECVNLNKRFFTFHEHFRPYVILKWAQSINGKIGELTKRVMISNDFVNRIVHKWRSEAAAILIGTNTAAEDDPLLTARLWRGKNPTRIVIDRNLKLSPSLKVFNNEAATIVYNTRKNATEDNLHFIKISAPNQDSEQNHFPEQILASLFELNIQSVLIEGGTKTLQSFIDLGIWDEARIITNEKLSIENGIAAPEMKGFVLQKQENYLENTITYYRNSRNNF
ncbi:MAG: bifunctional diaminohydroxyphosphoribosylaminopyrimidine deaminase/5-amino-6-(5-phosphoribosylamino)uracil reductase RibD [Ginsengibacter sp.]